MRERGKLFILLGIGLIFCLFAGNIIYASNSNSKIKLFGAYEGKEKIFSTFTKDTGIKIEYLDMSSGEVLARLKAEKGTPLADIWFGGGVDSFIAAKNNGLLIPYISKESKYIPEKYKDPEGYWTGLSIVLISFIVNTDIAKELNIPIPQTWSALINPKFKDEISMSNPAISGTAYTILTGILQTMGKTKGWEFIGKLNKNIDYYAKRGSEPYTKAALGEVMVGLATDTGIELQREGYPIITVFPKDGIFWCPSPVAILKGTTNPEGAKKFVDWCLSERGQKVLSNNCPRIPTRKGVEIPKLLKSVENTELQKINFEEAGKLRTSIIEEWKNKFDK